MFLWSSLRVWRGTSRSARRFLGILFPKIPNPIAFVKRGYDQIAATYHARRNLLDNRDLLEEFVRFLILRGRVLDIGCDAGVPVIQFLVASECTVTGIDVSWKLLAVADSSKRVCVTMGKRCWPRPLAPRLVEAEGLSLRAYGTAHGSQHCNHLHFGIGLPVTRLQRRIFSILSC
jgi:hypothetical protein